MERGRIVGYSVACFSFDLPGVLWNICTLLEIRARNIFYSFARCFSPTNLLVRWSSL